MFLPKEFKPTKNKKCDTEESRRRFKDKKNTNLRFLLEKRFLWMSKYIKNKKNIIELGSGNGASKDLLKNSNIILSDIQKYSWINKKIDMNNLKLKKKFVKKVDVFIINQALHHCSNPANLIKQMSKYLRKDGLILINEPEISFSLKLLLYLLNDEAWSLNVNIFNYKKNIFNPKSVWDANNATAQLLFQDENKFHLHFPDLVIKKNKLCEFLTFINSGGVVQKTFCIPINKFFFSLIDKIDSTLIFLFPSIFALGRYVILKKK